MEDLLKDLRYGVRSFLKRPGFLFIAVSTLALGIGGATAMFTVVNSVLLRPLQFPQPEQIVLFEGINPQQGITQSNMSVPDITDWQQQNQSFEQIAGFSSGGVFLSTGDETERVRATGASAYNLKTMNDVVSISAAPRRIPMLLLSAFAGVAMLLAMLGIYGVTSYYVTQRTHEIGVRMALGAQINDVLKLVVGRSMLLAVIGIGIGGAGAVAVTRYMTALLFGVEPVDTITFVAVAVVLAMVVLVACLVPAHRAAKIDPLEALR